MTNLPTAAGASSFNLIDEKIFFDALSIPENATIVDAACGAGIYLLNLSRHLEKYQKMIGLDLWEDGINKLNAVCKEQNLQKIQGIQCDLGEKFPLETEFADLCLMTTVIHDLKFDGIEKNAIKEVYRILKPGGILAVVEFKKLDSKPGPRKSIRLSPQELQLIVEEKGLKQKSSISLGDFTYLSIFEK